MRGHMTVVVKLRLLLGRRGTARRGARDLGKFRASPRGQAPVVEKLFWLPDGVRGHMPVVVKLSFAPGARARRGAVLARRGASRPRTGGRDIASAYGHGSVVERLRWRSAGGPLADALPDYAIE